jgi:hypothetical protein
MVQITISNNVNFLMLPLAGTTVCHACPGPGVESIPPFGTTHYRLRLKLAVSRACEMQTAVVSCIVERQP